VASAASTTRLSCGTPIADPRHSSQSQMEVALDETLSTNIPKALWLDRCVMSIGKLKPEISIEEAQTVALNILWSDVVDKIPEEAAEAWACGLEYR